MKRTFDHLFSIGLSGLNLKDYLSSAAQLKEETPLRDAIDFFIHQGVPQLAVVDAQNHLLGVLDSIDILEYISEFSISNTGGYSEKVSADVARDGLQQSIKSFVRQPDLVVSEKQSLEYNIREILLRGLPSAFVVCQEGYLKGELRLECVSSALSRIFQEYEHFSNYVISSVQNSVIAINAQGRVIYYNDSAEMNLPFKRSDIMGKPIKEFFPESVTYKALESGERSTGLRMQFGDRNFLADTFPVSFGNDKLLGAVAILKDVTELEAVTDRLTTSERLMATLEAVVENSYEGMMVIDEQERIILMNRFFLEVVGLEARDVIGRPIQEIIPGTPLLKTLKTGQAQFGEKWRISDRDFIIMRIPIEREGKIVGAIAKTLFNNIEIAKVFAKKVMRLEEDLAYYKEEYGKVHSTRFDFQDIIGESSGMKVAKELAKRTAETTATVLILGESGTGKEVFAHAIHEASYRRGGPFIKINCAALPDNLLESELFGYVEGAFTGARKGGKPGRFEQADKGTIFLDEIGDTSLAMQAKLLRVLQEREVERLGGTQPIKVDVRVIAATNRNLHQMVMEHQFRLDLYYRLNVVALELPPLRERREDIAAISRFILRKINDRLGTAILNISSESLAILREYHWPGNIRELENILERAAIICDSSKIQPQHLTLPNSSSQPMRLVSDQLGRMPDHPPQNLSLEEALAEAERGCILGALKRADGNKVLAAKYLGIHRSVLYKKMGKYNVSD